MFIINSSNCNNNDTSNIDTEITIENGHSKKMSKNGSSKNNNNQISEESLPTSSNDKNGKISVIEEETVVSMNIGVEPSQNIQCFISFYVFG